MKLLYIYCFLLSIVILVLGCTPRLSVEEYDNWLLENKNRLESRVKCDGAEILLEYVPVSFNMAKKSISKEDIREEVIMTVVLPDNSSMKEDPAIFNSYTELFLPEDVFLIQGKDTVPCIVAQAEAGLMYNSQRRVVLLFKSMLKRNGDEVRILYTDHIFSCKEKLLFEFPELKISELPQIKKI